MLYVDADDVADSGGFIHVVGTTVQCFPLTGPCKQAQRNKPSKSVRKPTLTFEKHAISAIRTFPLNISELHGVGDGGRDTVGSDDLAVHSDEALAVDADNVADAGEFALHGNGPFSADRSEAVRREASGYLDSTGLEHLGPCFAVLTVDAGSLASALHTSCCTSWRAEQTHASGSSMPTLFTRQKRLHASPVALHTLETSSSSREPNAAPAKPSISDLRFANRLGIVCYHACQQRHRSYPWD